MNCKKELIRFHETTDGHVEFQIEKGFHSVVRHDGSAYLRCRSCGYSGTKIPTAIEKLFGEEKGED